MTVGCARCHDHKFDPIPQKDYYRIQAVFFSTRPRRTIRWSPPHEVERAPRGERSASMALQKPLQQAKTRARGAVPQAAGRRGDRAAAGVSAGRLAHAAGRAHRRPAAERRADREDAAGRYAAEKITEKDIVALMPEDERQRHAELKDADRGAREAEAEAVPDGAWRSAKPARAAALVLPAPRQRRRQGLVMTPGVLSVVGESELRVPAAAGRREVELAAARLRRVARLAGEPADRARDGEPHLAAPFRRRHRPHAEQLRQDWASRPSHPELLDWLALEFVERGWSVKAMHRLMLTSQAYQMASDDIAANVAIDPENRFFWRMPRAAAGGGDHSRPDPGGGGHARSHARRAERVPVYRSGAVPGELASATWPGKPDDDPSTWRRSLYVFSKRSIRYPLFEAFDQPNLINSCDRRNRSTIAPQALLLMNNAMVLHAGEDIRRAPAARSGRRCRGAGAIAASGWRWAARRMRERTGRVGRVRAAGEPDGLAGLLPGAVQPQRVRLPPMSDRCIAHEHRSAAARGASCSGGSAAASRASRLPICWRGRGLLAARRSRIRWRPSRRTSRQGQGGDLDLLLRRREPGRHVRSQADAAEAPGRNDDGRGRGARRSMGTPGGLMPSPWKFKKHGQCGMDVSELFPHVAEHADDLALIRSMHALSPAHGPALFQMNTGSILAGHPSVGSWVTYGLGTREREPARLHRLHRLSRRPDQRRAQLGQRLHAGRLSGHAVPRQRRSRSSI